jgi:hypothetical protein
VFLAERAGGGRIGIAIFGRPIGPDPQLGIAAVQPLVEGAVEGEFFEQIAFLLAEFLERRGALRTGAPFA